MWDSLEYAYKYPAFAMFDSNSTDTVTDCQEQKPEERRTQPRLLCVLFSSTLTTGITEFDVQLLTKQDFDLSGIYISLI